MKKYWTIECWPRQQMSLHLAHALYKRSKYSRQPFLFSLSKFSPPSVYSTRLDFCGPNSLYSNTAQEDNCWLTCQLFIHGWLHINYNREVQLSETCPHDSYEIRWSFFRRLTLFLFLRNLKDGLCDEFWVLQMCFLWDWWG